MTVYLLQIGYSPNGSSSVFASVSDNTLCDWNQTFTIENMADCDVRSFFIYCIIGFNLSFRHLLLGKVDYCAPNFDFYYSGSNYSSLVFDVSTQANSVYTPFSVLITVPTVHGYIVNVSLYYHDSNNIYCLNPLPTSTITK